MKSPGFLICVEPSRCIGKKHETGILINYSIPYNPVFFAYATITPDSATLYINESKLTDKVKEHLGNDVQIQPYNAIFEDLQVLGSKVTSDINTRKYLISTKASWALTQALGGDEKVEEVRSPIADAKVVKNSVEMEGARACHIRDGAAFIEYFAWLEDQLITKQATVDEATGADKLYEFRSSVPAFLLMFSEYKAYNI
jgi:Xaa-Pro aminopeptidase